MGGRERRLFARYPLKEAFYCYAVDGTRLDAHSEDISAGGIFLKTEDELEAGAPIALVFKNDPSRTSPIYLTGKIVRRTTEPTSGVGVEWVKAVSNGPQAELTQFLCDVLRLRDPQIRAEVIPGQGPPRVEFTFPRVAVFGDQDVQSFLEDEEEETADLSEQLRQEREARAPQAPAEAPLLPSRPAPAFVRSREDGALTRQIEAGELRSPANVKAFVDIGGTRSKGLITHLGTKGLFLRTLTPPREPVKRADVSFELRVRGGMATIRCRCKVLNIDDGHVTRTPGLDLELVRVDEDGQDGVLRAYVRWLTFRAMAPGNQ